MVEPVYSCLDTTQSPDSISEPVVSKCISPFGLNIAGFTINQAAHTKNPDSIAQIAEIKIFRIRFFLSLIRMFDTIHIIQTVKF